MSFIKGIFLERGQNRIIVKYIGKDRKTDKETKKQERNKIGTETRERWKTDKDIDTTESKRDNKKKIEKIERQIEDR